MITVDMIGSDEQHPDDVVRARTVRSAEAVGRYLNERRTVEIARARTPEEATDMAFRLAERHAGTVTTDRP